MSAVAEVVQQAEQPKRELAPWVQMMVKAQPRFEELASIHGEVNWKAEASFAKQAFQKNPQLQECTPESVFNAIINVGAIGLTLSPAERYAHLVPRRRKDGGMYITECQLEIGYQGLIKLATDTGNCDYVRADVVREKDAASFQYHGPAAAPTMSINPFDTDRGRVVGAYAVARLASGDVLCEVMTEEELKATEESSKAQYGPWKGPFRSEMQKKTVLKRICKTIPRTKQSGRLHKAIEIVNQHEGMEEQQDVIEHRPTFTNDQFVQFTKALSTDNAALIWHLNRTLPTSVYTDLYNSGPKGSVTKIKRQVDQLWKKGLAEFQAVAVELAAMMPNDDTMGAIQILEDYRDMMESLHEQITDPELREWVDGLEVQE